MTILAAAATMAMLALCSCDQGPEALVHTGQEARDEAKEIVAIDADQKIAMARQLISAGKTTDAQRLLDPFKQDPSKLSAATQEKLQQALKELEQAKGSR